MTTEEQALLRAICLDPADDGPRLIYADWLEEQDRGAHAWLIRDQIHGERRGTGYNVPACEDHIVVAPDGQTGRVIPINRYGDETVGVRITRGLVAEWGGGLPVFLDVAAVLFAEQPVVEVELSDAYPLDNAGVDAYFGHARNLADRWYWLQHWGGNMTHWEVPKGIWDLLPIESDMDRGEYSSFTRANDGLHRACVAWGRECAGLPPLPVPAEVS